MSLASILVIYLINQSADQYLKILKQNQEKKIVKITMTIKIFAKIKKLRNTAKTAYFQALLPDFGLFLAS